MKGRQRRYIERFSRPGLNDSIGGSRLEITAPTAVPVFFFPTREQSRLHFSSMNS